METRFCFVQLLEKSLRRFVTFLQTVLKNQNKSRFWRSLLSIEFLKQWSFDTITRDFNGTQATNRRMLELVVLLNRTLGLQWVRNAVTRETKATASRLCTWWWQVFKLNTVACSRKDNCGATFQHVWKTGNNEFREMVTGFLSWWWLCCRWFIRLFIKYIFIYRDKNSSPALVSIGWKGQLDRRVETWAHRCHFYSVYMILINRFSFMISQMRSTALYFNDLQ